MACLFFPSTDVNSIVDEIVKKEPLITATKVDKVKELIESTGDYSFFPLKIALTFICKGLQEKLSHQEERRFYLFKVLRAHILPLTYVAFNKSGSA